MKIVRTSSRVALSEVRLVLSALLALLRRPPLDPRPPRPPREFGLRPDGDAMLEWEGRAARFTLYSHAHRQRSRGSSSNLPY